MRTLIAARMPFRSWAALSRATGIPQIDVKIDTATRKGHLPSFDVVAALIEVTDLTLSEIVAAAAADAGYPDLTPPVSREDSELIAKLMQVDPRMRELVDRFLDVAFALTSVAELQAQVEDLERWRNGLFHGVGVAGLEPAPSGPPDRRANHAAPHPADPGNGAGGKPIK